jgi:cytosine/adenosine deaminase-related metal-dependent hydrolase
MLLQRVAPDRYLSEPAGGRGGFAGNAGVMSARDALEIATRGSAAALGRDDVGQLAAGMSADFIALNLNRLDYAGAWHDPVAAVLFCGSRGVDLSVINGRIVVEGGRLTTIDLEAHLPRHNVISRAMIAGE